MISLLFITLNVLFAIFLFFLVLAFITGAPFVPSTKKTAEAMIDLARIKKGMQVYDLGSGEGRLLTLAKEKGAVAIGFEINPFLVLLCRMKGLTVYWKNFWNVDVSDADAVFVYLIPWKMDALETFLKSQLKPGTIVVSNSFIFPNFKKIREDKNTHVYVFRI